MTGIFDTEGLGRRVREERRAQNLTQEQLAALSGTGVRFIRELELGKESCRLGLALKVLTNLGLNLNITSRRDSS